jgi:hypothetical protein
MLGRRRAGCKAPRSSQTNCGDLVEDRGGNPVLCSCSANGYTTCRQLASFCFTITISLHASRSQRDPRNTPEFLLEAGCWYWLPAVGGRRDFAGNFRSEKYFVLGERSAETVRIEDRGQTICPRGNNKPDNQL